MSPNEENGHREAAIAEEERVEEPTLDPEIAARRSAALAHVRTFRDPALRTKATEVERFDETLLADVERYVHIRVAARDETGEGIRIEASGLEARVLQHEIDHLDGVLILDRTTRDQRKEAMRTLRERLEAA